MPDPVGKAISCLLDRINELEQQLARLRMKVAPDNECADCNDICSELNLSAPSRGGMAGAMGGAVNDG